MIKRVLRGMAATARTLERRATATEAAADAFARTSPSTERPGGSRPPSTCTCRRCGGPHRLATGGRTGSPGGGAARAKRRRRAVAPRSRPEVESEGEARRDLPSDGCGLAQPLQERGRSARGHKDDQVVHVCGGRHHQPLPGEPQPLERPDAMQHLLGEEPEYQINEDVGERVAKVRPRTSSGAAA